MIETQTLPKVKFRPCGDRVLVKPNVATGEVKKGGIIIPETAKDKPLDGVVVSVGRGKRDANGVMVPTETQVGDQVVFGKYAGSEIKIDELDYLVIHDEDVIGIIGEDA